MVIQDTLRSVSVDGDKMIFDHISDARATLALAELCRKENNGNYTDSREQRLIGLIDPVAWQKLAKEKPDIVRDGRKLWKWIHETEEGKVWRTNTAGDTGKSGKVVVK